jgi:peptide/nickel transport system substrate-binding protein
MIIRYKLKINIKANLIFIILLLCFGCGDVKKSEENFNQNNFSDDSTFEVETLFIGTTAPNEPFTLYSQSGSFGKMNYNGFVGAPFWVLDSKGIVKPFIVTEWTINDTGNEIIAKIAVDQGIKWHDGIEFTIDDVIFTFEYLKNNRTSGHISDVERVEQISSDEIKIILKSSGAFQWIFAHTIDFMVLPKHIWEKVEDPLKFTELSAAIGCGPYRLVSIDEDAQISTYEAIGDSYLGRKLTVKRVVIRTYSSHDTLIMAMKKGVVDAMYDYSNSLEATMYPAIQNTKYLDPGMSDNLGNFQIVYGFRRNPTNDLAFRKAVTMALDYDLLSITIGGNFATIPSIGVIAPPNFGFDDTLQILKQNIKEANLILDEAGYVDVDGDGVRENPSGEIMEVSVLPQYNRVKNALYLRLSEIVIQNLSDIGVKALIDEKGVSNYDYNVEMLNSGSYQIFIGYTSPGVAKQRSAYFYFVDSSVTNLWGTCDDPEFINVYLERKQAVNRESYFNLTKRLQQINSNIYMAAPLCWSKVFFPYRTDKYVGWVNYPGWGVINWETWYLLSKK